MDNYFLVEKALSKNILLDKDEYRVLVSGNAKYSWKITYKYSDLYISSDNDILDKIKEKILSFYEIVEDTISKNPLFEKSLNPIQVHDCCVSLIKEMCSSSAKFNVGPMASVAGALCEYIAKDIDKKTKYLVIENGGDIYLRANKDINIGVFLKSKYFNKNDLIFKLKKEYLPCGIASSSGTFGHSLSLGKSDLVVVIAKNAMIADSAATSIGNRINTKDDIEKTINHFKNYEEILGLIIIKDDKIGLYGIIELV